MSQGVGKEAVERDTRDVLEQKHAAQPASAEVLSTGQSALGNTHMAARAARLRSNRGGAPLSASVRGSFERSLGADLSGVRVHTGDNAVAEADHKRAHAFAKGQDIYGAPDKLNPETPDGRTRLAHEVIHTVQNQQSGVQAVMADSNSVSSSHDAAEVEARTGAAAVASGQSFNVSQAPSAAVSLDSAAIRAVIDDATKTAADVLAAFAAEDPSWRAEFFTHTGNVTAFVGKVNGDQAISVLKTIEDGWVDPIDQVDVVRLAGAASTGPLQHLLHGFDAWAKTAFYTHSDIMAFLKGHVQGGPLELFSYERQELSADALASGDFMAWLLSDTTAAEILRAAASCLEPKGQVAQRFAGLDTSWLDKLPSGAGLTIDQQNAIIGLRDALPDANAFKEKLNAKLASFPLTASPDEAWWQMEAMLDSTDTSPDPHALLNLAGQLDVLGQVQAMGRLDELLVALGEALFAQLCLLLNMDLITVLQEFKNQGVTQPGVIMDTIRANDLTQRKALAANQELVSWVCGICTGVPFQVFAVDEFEQKDFIEQRPFFKRLLSMYTGLDLLSMVTSHNLIAASARQFEVFQADALTWLGSLPPVAGLSQIQNIKLRGLRLVWTNPTLTAWVDTYFGDAVSPTANAGQGAAAVDESVYESPRARLDAAIAAGDHTAVIKAIGALRDNEATAVRANDANIIHQISGALGGDQFYHAMVALGLAPDQQLFYLLDVEGHGDPSQIQSILSGCSSAELKKVASNAKLVEHLSNALDCDPLPCFGLQGALPQWAFGQKAFMTWILNASDPLEILRVLGTRKSSVERATAALDSLADGWVWLAGMPATAMAFSAQERRKLGWIKNKTRQAELKTVLKALLDNTEDQMGSPQEALDALKEALNAPAPDGARALRLVTQLDDAGQREILDNQRAQAVAAFDAEQMAQFVMRLEGPMLTRLQWVTQAGEPSPQGLQRLLNQGSGADWQALFGDAAVVQLCMDVLDIGPSLALPGLDAVLAGCIGQPLFWEWTLMSTDDYEVLRLAATANPAQCMKAVSDFDGHKNRFADVPKGTGLAPSYRPHIDTLMDQCGDGDWQKKLFEMRWDVLLTGPWEGTTPGDLLMLHKELKTMPLEHITNNVMLQIIHRHHDGGGTYDNTNRQIDIGADPATTETFHDGQPHAYTETYFDHTVRHEVGHAVDALMGERTDITFNWAGWYEYGESEVSDWVDALGGWVDSRGAPVSAQEKSQILAALSSFMNSADSVIDGPGVSIFDMVDDDHPLNTRQDLKIVDALLNTNGKMHYTSPFDDGTHVWSINYYYQRWMKVKKIATTKVPRDYALFSPAEWFADLYAEFYRQYDGTAATASKLGGNVPGPVKTWFMNNVHTVGFDPHNRRDAGGPRTGVHGSH